MKAKSNLIALLFLLLGFGNSRAQEFFEDGSMILSAVSTNKQYGYQPTHKTAIKVGSVANAYAFLGALRGPNGEPLSYRRISSCCEFKSKSGLFGIAMLDKYELNYQGLPEPIVIYLNSYEYNNPKAPYGFTFVRAHQIYAPIKFPAERIVKVDFCDSATHYAVRDHLLKEKFGELTEPDTAPTYEGGLAALKEYFAGNPLTDPATKALVFRVAIGFVVDCNGQAGNFMVISKGKGRLETFANQVLDRVNSMPQQWRAATVAGEKVDCYQVLTFTVNDGQLSQVSYR